jgi:hypothetical protein
MVRGGWMLYAEVSNSMCKVSGIWPSHESGSILRKMARYLRQIESNSAKKCSLILDRGSPIANFGIYPMENPKGNLRNKICAPISPAIRRTASQPNADFNSPHSPVCKRCALGCPCKNKFHSGSKTGGIYTTEVISGAGVSRIFAPGIDSSSSAMMSSACPAKMRDMRRVRVPCKSPLVTMSS